MAGKKWRVNLSLAPDLARRVKRAAAADDRNPSSFLPRLIRIAMDAVEVGDLYPESNWTDEYMAKRREEKERDMGDNVPAKTE